MPRPPFLFRVIHEDAALLVLHKPAGLACHPTKAGEFSSLVGRLRLYLGLKVPIHLIHRLDRETGGVVLVAKSGEAARELRRLWESRRVRKTYRAIVHGRPRASIGEIDCPIGKDAQSEVAIRARVDETGAPCLTRYALASCFEKDGAVFSRLIVRPVTGRKHQIRVHLAEIGCPIVGDKLYGRDPDAYLAFVHDRLTERQIADLILPCHALHAARLEFSWRGARHVYESPEEPWMSGFDSAVLIRR